LRYFAVLGPDFGVGEELGVGAVGWIRALILHKLKLGINFRHWMAVVFIGGGLGLGLLSHGWIIGFPFGLFHQ
jgi:hypothetical protein